jgi:hypothetical protein
VTNRRRNLLTFAAVAPVVAVAAGCERTPRILRIDNPGELVEHPLRSAELLFPIALRIPRGIRARTLGDDHQTFVRINFVTEDQLDAVLAQDWASAETIEIDERSRRARSGKEGVFDALLIDIRAYSWTPSEPEQPATVAALPLSANGFRYRLNNHPLKPAYINAFRLYGERSPLACRGVVGVDRVASQILPIIAKVEHLLLRFWEARTPHRPIKGVR